jgi:hypothetical protein
MASIDLDSTSNTTDIIRELFTEIALLSTPTVLAESPVETCEVLESIEEDDVYQTLPISILCPGCSNVIKQYPDGLPSRLAHFNEICPHDDIDLHRWSVVAVNSAYEEMFSTDQLRQVTTQYWDRHLWDGIISGETNPRTQEFTTAYREQAAGFGWDWQVTCPLCRQSLAELGIQRLDYHHWRREPDQGVCLCRSCHEAINGGTRDYECDWRAQELGLKNKFDLQITRLAIREQAVNTHGDIKGLSETLSTRYNLVHSASEVSHLLSQTLQSEEILEDIADQYLFVDLPENAQV